MYIDGCAAWTVDSVLAFALVSFRCARFLWKRKQKIIILIQTVYNSKSVNGLK